MPESIPTTEHAAALEALFGLKDLELRVNLTKEELFHEAIANDRGRVREGRRRGRSYV